MELEDLADRVVRVAGDVEGARGRLAHADPGPVAFAGSGPGALFSVGRDLHERWVSALAAREREAVAHAARLVDLSEQVRQAAVRYRATEDTVARRHRGGPDPGWP